MPKTLLKSLRDFIISLKRKTIILIGLSDMKSGTTLRSRFGRLSREYLISSCYNSSPKLISRLTPITVKPDTEGIINKLRDYLHIHEDEPARGQRITPKIQSVMAPARHYPVCS